MGSIAVKKQLALTLTQTIRANINDGNLIAGQEWPCHVVSVDGAIVTVAFDMDTPQTLPQVTCAVAESFYVLLPIQVGDKGMVVSASARLGGVTGLGAGLAPTIGTTNLGGLVFVPLGHKSWTLPDANAVIVQGPNGVIARTIDGTATVTINETEISLNWSGSTVVINDSGITLTAEQNTIDGDLTVNGASTFNGDVTIIGVTTTTGPVTITGDVEITGSVALVGPVLMSGAVEIVGSLSVNGKDFSSHTHLPGSYHIGGNSVLGDSGGVAP